MGISGYLILMFVGYAFFTVGIVVNAVLENRLRNRVDRLETVFRQLGPTAEARLQENGTKVVMPPRWFDEMEES